jgi:hypothetical protein
MKFLKIVRRIINIIALSKKVNRKNTVGNSVNAINQVLHPAEFLVRW